MDWFDWEPVLKKVVVEEMRKAPEVSKEHGLDHVERVWSGCLKLGMKLNADLEVLVAAAYLHDLGRHYGLDLHGEKSAQLGEPILLRIKFPKEKIKKVLDAISLHDHQVKPEKRRLIETQILYDADKLDAFGAIGVERWVLHRHSMGYSIEEVLSRIQQRYDGLHLRETKNWRKNAVDTS